MRVFQRSGIVVFENDAGGLRLSGEGDLSEADLDALVESIRKWRASRPVAVHLSRLNDGSQ